MVNRNLQAKDNKRKNRGKSKRRAKKSVNTGTSYINYARSPNSEGMAILRGATGNTIFRDRAGSIHVNHSITPETLAFWEARYPSMKYSKKDIKERGLPDEYGIIKNNPVPRGEALRRADEMMKETDITLHFRLKKGPWLNVDLFFNSKKTKWFILETDLDRRHIRKSGVYPHREIVEGLYSAGRIEWRQTIPILPEDSS